MPKYKLNHEKLVKRQKQIHWVRLPEFDPSVTLFPSGEVYPVKCKTNFTRPGSFATTRAKLLNRERLMQCKSDLWTLKSF